MVDMTWWRNWVVLHTLWLSGLRVGPAGEDRDVTAASRTLSQEAGRYMVIHVTHMHGHCILCLLQLHHGCLLVWSVTGPGLSEGGVAPPEQVLCEVVAFRHTDKFSVTSQVTTCKDAQFRGNSGNEVLIQASSSQRNIRSQNTGWRWKGGRVCHIYKQSKTAPKCWTTWTKYLKIHFLVCKINVVTQSDVF